MSLSITLKGTPYSTNSLYRTTKNHSRLYMTEKGESIKLSYSIQAKTQVRQQGWECTDKPLDIEVFFYFPDKKRRDWDNYHKIAQDSMNGVVYKDDDQIFNAIVHKRLDRENPRIEYVISYGQGRDA